MVPLDSHRVSRAPWYSGGPTRKTERFRLPGCHRLWRAFPDPSANARFCNFPAYSHFGQSTSHDTACTTDAPLHANGLGCSLFARRYSGNRGFLSSPRGTEMSHFSRLASRTYGFSAGYRGIAAMGFPIRVSPHQNLLKLHGAYRSLPRPSSPLRAKASPIRP